MALLVAKFRLLKDGANGNQLISINNSQTGKFSDAVNTDAFVTANMMNFQSDTTTEGVGGYISYQFASVMIENTTPPPPTAVLKDMILCGGMIPWAR